MENSVAHLIFWGTLTLFYIALSIGSLVFAVVEGNRVWLLFSVMGVLGAWVNGRIALEGP